MPDSYAPEFDPIQKLTKDLKEASTKLSADEARFLVDAYYQLQRDRIRSGNQVRATQESEEPHAVLRWLASQTETLEAQIKRALDAYTDSHAVGRWSRSIVGIGPILAAGLIAHIDITKAPTCGHIWRFAGLDPTVQWKKGEKRPWNASLKTLCWKVGESFVKVSGNDNDVYGKLYLERKGREIEKNDAGAFADQAAAKLAKFNIGRDTDARKHYEAGRLPPAHIHARAKRWAVKLFIAHFHAVAYRDRFGVDAPKPYVLSVLQHGHEIVCPNWPF